MKPLILIGILLAVACTVFVIVDQFQAASPAQTKLIRGGGKEY